MDDVLIESLDFYKLYRSHLTELLARRDIDSAIRYFESIRDSLDDNHGPDSGATMRLGAKAYYLSGDYSSALPIIRIAVHIFAQDSGDSTELGECFMILGNILRELGSYDEAERAYRDAESIHRRSDNISECGEALNRLSGVLFRKGDLDTSLKYLIESIKCAEICNDKKKLAYLFGNIGRIYTLLGKLDSAEEHIRLNIGISAEFNDEVELARAYLSLGYLCIEQERFEEAQIVLEKALHLIKSNNMNKEEVIYLTYLGELMLKTGQYATSEKVLNRAASDGASMAPDSLLALRPMRHLTELATKQGNFQKALALIKKTLPKMQKLNYGIEIGALMRIRGFCLASSGKSSEAAECYKQSIEILEEHKAKFELADCLAEMGRSGIFDTRQQFRYLCRAEELYHDCNIQLKVLEMQKLISRLELKTGKAKIAEKLGEVEKNSFPTKNARMAKIISQLRLLRNCELPILLIGETGTGKDHLARYFHSISRPSGPFVAVNCAAVPDNLLESELFGYQKGAFTGADSDKRGLFSAANAGVILLDEIGELPLPLQAKLLSVIETKRLRPLGTAHEIELNLTIVAATNRNLYEMVKEGIFRTDLYYRLAGVTIELPPLRERKEDIPCLLELFMRQNDLLDDDEKVDSELISQFVHYEWPGNIRQMENKVKHLSILRAMAKEGSIAELSRGFFEEAANESTSSLFEQVEQFEKRLIQDALAASNGNKSKAAKVLQIHESTFREKMKRYGILEALAS